MESLLSRSSIGHRLDLRPHRIDRTRQHLFQYWRPQYNRFRDVPIRKAREALDKGAAVFLVSADLTSFYDTVDPSFLLSESFIQSLKESRYNRKHKSFNASNYCVAVRSLLVFYSRFRRMASRYTGRRWETGIPIGALTSRLVGNLALATLDREVESRKKTLCYRRYVDDMIIVANAPAKQAGSLKDVLLDCIPHLESRDDALRLSDASLDRIGSRFEIKLAKCKVHHLAGRRGVVFLASVQAEFGRLVSEARAFLDPELLAPGPLPNLVRVTPGGKPLTVLREADRQRLEHWTLAVRLRTLERMATLVDSADATEITRKATRDALEFLHSDLDWVENLERVFRILQVGLRLSDWDGVRELLHYLETTWNGMRGVGHGRWKLYYRGSRIGHSSAARRLDQFLCARRLEVICRAMRPMMQRDIPPWLRARIDGRHLGRRALLYRARLLAEADLRLWDREDDAFTVREKGPHRGVKYMGIAGRELRRRLDQVKVFVRMCETEDDRAWRTSPASLFLSTRPPSYTDIARRVLRVSEHNYDASTFDRLTDMVNNIRGTRYWRPIARLNGDRSLQVPIEDRQDAEWRDPRLILGNLVLTEHYYCTAVTPPGERDALHSVRDVKRLRGLTSVLAAANREATRQSDRHTILVLPELGVPRTWFRGLAKYVSNDAKFALVTGLEYAHDRSASVVRNEVYAVLPTGYKSALTWLWTKRFPAREEVHELSKRGLTFPPVGGLSGRRTVLDTPYGQFSVLICSEMIEAGRVEDLVGRVEMVLVPSWNRDTSSYDHLVQTVGLQLNAIVAVANNGQYSDCRVWGPKTVRWRRDMCRLVARDRDDIVSVDAQIAALREFRGMAGAAFAEVFELKPRTPDWKPLPPDWPTATRNDGEEVGD